MTAEEVRDLFRQAMTRLGYRRSVPWSRRCETCRHWRQPPEGWEHSVALHGGRPDAPLSPDVGGCESPRLLKGYGWRGWEVPEGGALVEDDEGWALLTDRHYGCVNWTAREDEDAG